MLHAAVIGTLLQFDAVSKPLAQALPMMVDLITPPKPEPPLPAPKIEPRKLRPVEKAPRQVQQAAAPPEPPLLAA
ncbi:MAG: hypothetical protein EXR29_03835 [Betaproteobacteria bacterium]|nr:hypothetical protein [Betaproteobacteria bacterium]